MNNFNVKNYDENKNYVIQASAGTGKTYNITKIVDKLVNICNFDLHKILIVTYTEKAAGELKDRIRSVIKNQDVDNAPIGTIHSFCQNTIKEFGLSANLPLNLNVIDENEINDFALRYIREGKILEDISFLLKNKFPFKADNLLLKLVQGVKKYYLDKNYNEDSSIISISNFDKNKEEYDFLKNVYSSNDLSELFVKFPNLEINYNNLLNSGMDECIEVANNFKKLFKEGFDLKKGDFSKAKYKSIQTDIAAFYDYKTKLQAIVKKKDLEKRMSNIFVTIYLKDFYQKWQEYKEKNKSQNFDDMIRNVREAIIHENTLKQKLKDKYTIAIIDEFQDTNQKQFDIFKNIFMEDDNHKIIVVGDPKQSIYSFQGADVNVYFDAVKQIEQTNSEICELNVNYRSTKDMVSSCNKIFNYYKFAGNEFRDCGFLDKDHESGYHDALYKGKKVNAFWIGTELDESELDENEFAKIASQQILDCCTKDKDEKTNLQIKDKSSETYRNVTFSDFAVLIHTGSEAKAMVKALSNAGIPHLKYKDKNLFVSKECAHWIALLEAINTLDFTGRNRSKLKKALFTGFFGKTLTQLNSEYFNKDDIEEIGLINKWKVYRLENKWEDLFDDIIISSNISERLKSLKELQSLAIYKQIGDYCIEFLSKGKSFEELIRNLNSLSNGENTDDEEQNGNIVEKSTNFNCVQIMTMHASKGLQFPIVIASGGFREPYKFGKAYTYHEKIEETGEQRQVLCFERTDEYVNEEIEEWKRLFYVAYTRPQFILMIPKYKKYGQKFLKESLDQYMEDHQGDYKIIKSNGKTYNELRKISASILKSSKEETESLEEKTNQDRKIKELIRESNSKKSYKHSYSSLSHGDHEIINKDELIEVNKEGIEEEGLSKFDKLALQIFANYDDNISPINIPLNYPKGAKLGTALHEIFEGLDFTNYNEFLELKINRCFSKQGITNNDEFNKVTTNIVHNVLNAVLPVIKGANVNNQSIKLCDITKDNKLDEVEFNFNVFNEKLSNYCNGFVDLIFKNNDTYAILDWKSDKLNDDFTSYCDAGILKKHVDECYSIQRVLYSYCLIKTLKLQYENLSYQEIFEKHFGGVYYVFLRGCNENTGNGVYCQTWNNWEDLEKSFIEITNSRIGGNHE